MSAATQDVDWDAIGYVISSKYRVGVVEALAECPKTPTTIADETDLGVTHISRALRRLDDRTIIELIVPEDQRKDRLYALTDRGEGVEANLEEVA